MLNGRASSDLLFCRRVDDLRLLGFFGLVVSSEMLSTERLTTVLTMACISSNRLCARVVQEKVYQLFVNNKTTPNVYQQQHRNQFTAAATGPIYQPAIGNRNQNNIQPSTAAAHQQFNGFSFLARNLPSGSNQVIASFEDVRCVRNDSPPQILSSVC